MSKEVTDRDIQRMREEFDNKIRARRGLPLKTKKIRVPSKQEVRAKRDKRGW